MSRTLSTGTIERRGIQQTSTTGMSALLLRVQNEYLEMPGLKLTETQTRRLCGLDPYTCRVVLATLVSRGFLKQSADGTYVRCR